MASMAEKIAEARKAGYSDEEIKQFVLGTKAASDAKAAGYSDDDIMQHFGLQGNATAPAATETPQSAGVLSEAGRLAGIAAGGLVKGAAAGLALPNTLQQLVDRGYRAGAGALGIPVAPEAEVTAAQQSGPLGMLNQAIQPPSNATMQGLVEPISGPTPQGVGENILSAGAQGVGAALMPGGGGATLTNAMTGAASGIGALGGEYLMPGTTIGPLVGGLLGGSLTGGVQSIMQGRQAQAGLRSAQQGFEAAEQGAQDAGDVVTDLTRQQQQLATQKQEMNLAHAKNLDDLQSAATKNVEQVASTLGSSTTLQQSGGALQTAAQNWLDKTFPKLKEDIWQPVDKMIPSDTPVQLDAFRGALKDINSSAGSLEPVAELMKPSLPKQIAKALNNVEGGQELGVAPPTTWADVRKLRTTLGDAMSNPSAIRDVGEQNLAHMYATLSEDLRNAAGAVSPEALQAFEGANAQTSQLFDVARGPISSIVTAKDPESAANALINAGKRGATDMQVLREYLPDAVNEVGATALRSGKWTSLSPEAQEQLITDPATRKMLSDSYGAIDTAKEAHSAAEQAHAQSVIDLGNQQNAARAAQDAAKIEQRQARGQVSSAQEEAATQAARWNPYGPLGLGIGGGSLATLGEKLGAAVGNPFGYESAGALGTMLGLGLPVAGMMAANPTIRGQAVRGAILGNELALPEPRKP